MRRRSSPEGKRRVRNWMCVIYCVCQGVKTGDGLWRRTWIRPDVVASISNQAASSPMAHSAVSVSLLSKGGISTAT